MTENPAYHQFQLDVDIDAKERYTYITKILPISTLKYVAASASISLVKPLGTIGASGSRTGEQNIATEKTTSISRIIQRSIRDKISWSFHMADPFDQEIGLVLPPEKLPRAHFDFRGKMPAPPLDYLTLVISTYWSVLSPNGGSVWLIPKDTPSFSNLCKIITLDLPQNLQGSHGYDVDLHIWPKHSNLNTTVSSPEGEVEEGVGGLVKAKVVDTDHGNNMS